MGTGVKHTTTGDGTKITNTVWSEEHTYDASLSTHPLQFVWKDASEQAMSDLNRTSSLGYTDLDLTSTTSSNAKIAYLRLRIKPDTVGSGNFVNLAVKKKGTSPTATPTLILGKVEAVAGANFYEYVFVGLDSNQTIQYSIGHDTGWQIDSYIDVLGYME